MPEPRRIPLACLPTPLHRLDRASADLGIDLWIKRDDLTGFALGGNKGRKLEYLMGEALDQCAEVVVSCGSLQSNFIRQLGAACSALGLRCAAVGMHLPYDPPAGKPEGGIGDKGGNVLLDEILGVDLRRMPDGDWMDLFAAAHALAEEYRRAGKRVYEVPVGGSSALGAYAFARAAEEVGGDFDFVVTASSSGSTQVGLHSGFIGTRTRVIGIACDPEPELPNDLAALAGDLDRLTGRSLGLTPSDFDFRLDWVGPGYGVPSPEGNAAISYLARTEGVFLDPVYSGKAFSGLMALARSGALTGKVLFWHTGGTPALFAHE